MEILTPLQPVLAPEVATTFLRPKVQVLYKGNTGTDFLDGLVSYSLKLALLSLLY